MDRQEQQHRFIEAVKMGLIIRYSQNPDSEYAHALGHLDMAYTVLENLPNDERSPEGLAEQFLRYNSPGGQDEYEPWMV